MKIRVLLALSASLFSLTALSPSALALDPKLEKYDTVAQQAFDGGDYKRAQNQWTKLQTELNKVLSTSPENAGELNAVLERALRRLGECCMALKDYGQAADLFSQAQKLTTVEQPDSDLAKDQGALAQVYRQVDPLSLGIEASNALKEVGAEKILVTKNDQGQHIDIALTDKVVKPIDQKGVTEIGFDKMISFDLTQSTDGEIKINNISGLRVHAAVWVNVIASKLKRNEQQEPIAEVTGQKMGISQSVSSKLPDEIYQPVMALVGKVTGLFNEVPTGADIASGGQGGAASAVYIQQSGQQSGQPSMQQGSDIVPVVNGGPVNGYNLPAANSASSSSSTSASTMTPILNNGPEPSPVPSPMQ